MNEIYGSIEVIKIWLPCLVSIVTLLVNIGFYIFIQPKLGYKYETKNYLRDISNEFFVYLTRLVSLDDYNGAPTKIREYSLKIHLCFKDGSANEEISTRLEKIFQMTKSRKQMMDAAEIEQWNDVFRNEVRKLRKELGKYCGGL